MESLWFNYYLAILCDMIKLFPLLLFIIMVNFWVSNHGFRVKYIYIISQSNEGIERYEHTQRKFVWLSFQAVLLELLLSFVKIFTVLYS